MTALTQAAPRTLEHTPDHKIRSIPVLNDTTIQHGSYVMMEPANGYAVPVSGSTGTSRFLGLADEQVVLTAADADGDAYVLIKSEGTEIVPTTAFDGTDPTIADVGETVYMIDDNTFTLAVGTTNITVGTLAWVHPDEGECAVHFIGQGV